MKKLMVLIAILALCLSGGSTAAQGTRCDAAELIAANEWVTGTLGPDETHFYKIFLQKGQFLKVNFFSDIGQSGAVSLQLRAHGDYAGTQYSCALLQHADDNPGDETFKVVSYVPELDGEYVLLVDSVYGSHGSYRLTPMITEPGARKATHSAQAPPPAEQPDEKEKGFVQGLQSRFFGKDKADSTVEDQAPEKNNSHRTKKKQKGFITGVWNRLFGE